MRILHDPERCALHGQCTIAAPAIFRFDERGDLAFDATPDESLRSDAEDAMDVCPERAITVVHDDG
jgi:ferredoxin